MSSFGDDVIDTLLQIRSDGMRAFDDVVDGLHRIEAATAATAAELQLLNVMNDAVRREAEGASDTIEAEADKLRQVKDQAAEASAALAIFTGAEGAAAAGAASLWSILSAPQGWAQVLVTSIAVLLVPILGIVGALASGLVILTAFTVGAAALAVTVGGLALGFVALGAAITALGINAMGGLAAPTAAALTPPSGAGVAAAQDRLQQAQEALAAFQAERAARPGAGARFDPTTGQITTGAAALTPAQQATQERLVDNVAKAQAALDVAMGKSADAQAKYAAAVAASQTPIQVFVSDVQNMLGVLGQAAIPFASLIINFGDKLIPVVQQAGLAIITWFGDRLPGVLNGLLGFINALTPAFTGFFTFIGKFFDSMMSLTTIGPGGTIVTMGQLIQGAVTSVIIPAIEGLLTNLGRLSQWFLERLPVFLPIINQIFGGTGNAVQGLGGLLGKFVDWIMANWPATMDTFNAAVKDAQRFWTDWGPVIQRFAADLFPKLGEIIRDIASHTGTWLAILLFVAGAISLVAVFVLGLLDLLLKFLDMMGQLGDGWKFLWDSITYYITLGVANIVVQINKIIEAWNNVAAIISGPQIGYLQVPGVAPQPGAVPPPGIRGHGGLQSFDYGGVVQGPWGSPQLIWAHAGEQVSTPSQQQRDKPLTVYSTLLVDGRVLARGVQKSDYNRRRGM